MQSAGDASAPAMGGAARRRAIGRSDVCRCRGGSRDRPRGPAAPRSGPRRQPALHLLRAGGSGRCSLGRVWARRPGHRTQPRGLGAAWSLQRPGPARREIVNQVAFLIVGVGIAWFGERLRRARIESRARQDDLRSPRGASAVDPRHGSGRDDRDRRAGIMQSFSSAAERLFGYTRGRGDRPERQAADALALSRGP